MKILACAVGFGLGPSGKLCSIVNYNSQYEPEISFEMQQKF